MLSPYRVLDLTDERGFLAGKILAELGADVVKVEPPGGDPARRLPPFLHGEPGDERSLRWLAMNTSKRGIVVDLEAEPGRRRLLQLAAEADVLVESAAPGAMEALGVGWDDLGRVASRSDANRTVAGGGSFFESFHHDDLDRLKSAEISGGPSVFLEYSPGGRIESKSDVGTYHYGEGGAGPDQLTSLSGATTTTFVHDDKGNVTSGLDRSLTWASYDKPTFITNSTSASTLTYGVDRRRIRQRKATVGQATTVTTYVGALYEETEVLSTAAIERHHYVMANGTRVALIVTSDTAGRATRYIHQDRLGSVAAVTDEQGAILVRYFYDPYGRTVDEQGQPLGDGQRSNVTTRGFTDHEHLDEVGLIHANARVLDPFLGQFVSRDPVGAVAPPARQAASSRSRYQQRHPQDVNPYSYAQNDPLVMSDPTGGQTWGLVGGMFDGVPSVPGIDQQQQPGCDLGCRNEMRPDVEGTAGHNSNGYGERIFDPAGAAAARWRFLQNAGAVVSGIVDARLIPSEVAAAIKKQLSIFYNFLRENGGYGSLTFAGALNHQAGFGVAVSLATDLEFEVFTVDVVLGRGIGWGLELAGGQAFGSSGDVGVAFVATWAVDRLPGVFEPGAFVAVRVGEVSFSGGYGVGVGESYGSVFGISPPGFQVTRQQLEEFLSR